MPYSLEPRKDSPESLSRIRRNIDRDSREPASVSSD
jgi:hypothetical protein